MVAAKAIVSNFASTEMSSLTVSDVTGRSFKTERWSRLSCIVDLTLPALESVTDGGRLPLAELARLANGPQTSLELLALGIARKSAGVGRRSREIIEAVCLDFVGFRAASALLDITRTEPARSITCVFDADRRDVVLDAMDQMVMAEGEVELASDGATIHVLHLSTLRSIPTADPKSIDELARKRGVGPVRPVEDLRVDDPGDMEEFLTALRSARGDDEGVIE